MKVTDRYTIIELTHLYTRVGFYLGTYIRAGFLHLVTERGSQMEITDVRVRKVAKEGKMKAIVSITFDNEFVVHDIKVIEGEKGLFIAMPSRKALDGEFRDIAHPINSETRDKLQAVILEKFETIMLADDAAISEPSEYDE